MDSLYVSDDYGKRNSSINSFNLAMENDNVYMAKCQIQSMPENCWLSKKSFDVALGNIEIFELLIKAGIIIFADNLIVRVYDGEHVYLKHVGLDDLIIHKKILPAINEIIYSRITSRCIEKVKSIDHELLYHTTTNESDELVPRDTLCMINYAIENNYIRAARFIIERDHRNYYLSTKAIDMVLKNDDMFYLLEIYKKITFQADPPALIIDGIDLDYKIENVCITLDVLLDNDERISPDIKRACLTQVERCSSNFIKYMLSNNRTEVLRKIFMDEYIKIFKMDWYNILPYGDREENFNVIMDILSHPKTHIFSMPDFILFMQCAYDHKFTPIIKYKIFELLITKFGLDPADNFNSAICWAAHYGCTNIVELLLKDPEVDPTIGNNYPLRFAAENGHIDVVSLLLADNQINPSQGNIYTLKHSDGTDHHRIFLFDHKRDDFIRNNYAIIKAMRNNHMDIAKMLFQRVSIRSIIQSERLPETEKIISDLIYPRLLLMSNIALIPDIIYYIKVLFLSWT